jgi:delta(3,5)-delta(2,4)-dienoyl-CoA isomerase
MWLNLRKIFEALSDDPSVRAIVLSGAGHAFTSGLDVKVTHSFSSQAGT